MYAGEDMTYTLKSGVIENSGLPRSTERGAAAQKIIISPVDLAPGSSLSLYFVYFHLGNFVNETCQDQRMEVRLVNIGSRNYSLKTAECIAQTIHLAPVF